MDYTEDVINYAIPFQDYGDKGFLFFMEADCCKRKDFGNMTQLIEELRVTEIAVVFPLCISNIICDYEWTNYYFVFHDYPSPIYYPAYIYNFSKEMSKMKKPMGKIVLAQMVIQVGGKTAFGEQRPKRKRSDCELTFE
jgi:hypothetical protein